MGADQIFAIARDVATFAAAIFVYYWGRSRKGDEAAVDAKIDKVLASMTSELQLRDERLRTLFKRFDDASERSSALSSAMQGLIGRFDRLPEDLRMKFLSIDRAEDHFDECRRGRDSLHADIDRIGESVKKECEHVETSVKHWARGAFAMEIIEKSRRKE